MKTLDLINSYKRLLEQNDIEDIPPVETDATPTDSNLSPNEKYIIKLLTNSFIFNPKSKKFNDRIQRDIFTKISSIKDLSSPSLAAVVSRVNNILSYEPSLKVESAVINLLNRLITVFEQSSDATSLEQEAEPVISNASAAPEVNDINLSEIFPTYYQELLINALSHTPTTEEMNTLIDVVDKFSESDPRYIRDVLATLISLPGGESDRVETNTTTFNEPDIEKALSSI